MQKRGIVRNAMKILDSRGFESVQLESVRSCFDVVARRKGTMLMLKIVENIDSIDAKTAGSVEQLNSFFGTSAFAVGNVYKGSRLQEGIAFSRHGISCISMSTMEHMIDGEQPVSAERFISAKYRIDGPALKEERRRSGASIGELSDSTGISRDSIYRYERHSPYVSLSNWNRLEKFFNGRLKRLRDTAKTGPTPDVRGAVPRDGRISMVEMDSGPFKMIGKMRFRYEAGQITDRRTSRKRAEVYGKIHELTGRDFPFFISDKASVQNVFGIPVMRRHELESISEEKELKEKLTERSTTY